MSKTFVISSLALIVLSACTKAPNAPSFRKYQGTGGSMEDATDPRGGKTGDQGSKTPAGVKETPTTISLANTKFKGDEDKLSAVVKYAGKSSEKVKLKAGNGDAQISIAKMSASKADSMVIEIYEGDKLKYKASKSAVAIDSTKANNVKIDDCAIHKLPWSGEANEAHCGWSVQDVKN